MFTIHDCKTIQSLEKKNDLRYSTITNNYGVKKIFFEMHKIGKMIVGTVKLYH